MTKPKPTDPNEQLKHAIATIAGQEIQQGDHIKVHGLKGTFVFMYQWLPDNSLACWDSKRHRMRAFRPEAVTIAKKPVTRRTK